MAVDIPKGKKLILFDGVCNFCNNTVNLIIKHDKKEVFVFTALQSEFGQHFTKQFGINTTKVDSIILYDPSVAYFVKADAALKIANEFSGTWKLLQVFRLLPLTFTNLVYDFIAKNRYKWFGRKDNCRIPTPELKAKFLE